MYICMYNQQVNIIKITGNSYHYIKGSHLTDTYSDYSLHNFFPSTADTFLHYQTITVSNLVTVVSPVRTHCYTNPDTITHSRV